MTPGEEKQSTGRDALPGRRALSGLRIAAIAVIVLGGVILTQVRQIGRGAGFIVVGPGIFPIVVGIGILVLGILFFLRTTIIPDRDLIEEVTAEEATTHWPTAAIALVSLVGYAALLHPLGYPLATTLFFTVAGRILGSKQLVRDVITGLVLGFGIFLVFTRLLGIRLPAGILAGIF